MSSSVPETDISGLSTSRLVAEIRRRTNETQEALARRLGVSFPTLNAWERGHREPRRNHRAQILAAAAELGIRRGARVLVIDDDPIACEVLTARIAALTAEADVRAVLNGAEGLIVCGAFRPDVLFLDIMMPDINGIDVAERLGNIDDLEDTYTVFCTGADDADILKRAEAASGHDVIRKPAGEAEVRKALVDSGALGMAVAQ